MSNLCKAISILRSISLAGFVAVLGSLVRLRMEWKATDRLSFPAGFPRSVKIWWALSAAVGCHRSRSSSLMSSYVGRLVLSL